jgi:hypothetical protein
MKNLLVVGCLLTVVVTPAFAQSFIDGGELPFANLSQVSNSDYSVFAQRQSWAKHPFHVKQKARNDVGIFENLPAGVTDPYAYHNELMRED